MMSRTISWEAWRKEKKAMKRSKKPRKAKELILAHKKPIIVPVKPRSYYWAYGSNLSIRNMMLRCPMAKKVCPLIVDGAALVFRAVADVVVREGAQIAGGLWLISENDEARLDAYEGVSGGLYMKRYLPIEVDGQAHDCLFYQMVTSRGVMPPEEEYLKKIAAGYEDFDLDTRLLDAALQESWGNKELTAPLQARHKRRGAPRLVRQLEEVL